ncbi:hypothetical protein Tco_1410665 [Tanacetum coccineum]
MPRWPSRKEEACGELEFTRSLLQVKMRRKYEQLIYSFKWTIKSNLEGLVSDFMASQDARLSKFEADFKRQQGEMTNNIDTVLKASTNQIAGTLPSDTPEESQVNEPDIKQEEGNLGNTNSNPQSDPLALIATEQIRKLNSMLESLGLVPQSSNAKFVCSKDDGEVMFIEIIRDDDEPRNEGPNKGKGATMEEPAVEYFDTFPRRDKLTYHRYHATLDTCILKKVRLTLAKIAVGEGITRSVFGVKGVDLGEEEAPYWTTLGKRESYKPRPLSDGIGARTPYYARKDFLDCHLPGEWEIARDAELNPFKDTLVFRRMVEFLGAIPINLKSNMWESEDLIKKPINWDKPPKNGGEAWHAKIILIDPDGEEFTETLQSIPTTRKLSERESTREIIDLDHFYDTLYLMRRILEILRKFHWTIIG